MTVGATASRVATFIRGLSVIFMSSSSARSWHRRAVTAWLASILAAASVVVAPVAHLVQPATASADGSFADAHFTETTVFSSLASPITVRFASDGRAFVAEKRGIIKAYDSVDDASATQVLDIRTVVHDFWDRGLMSIALDPDFLSGRPYIYVFYVYDAPPGQTAPFWDDDLPQPAGRHHGRLHRPQQARPVHGQRDVQRGQSRQPPEPHRGRRERRVVPAVPEPRRRGAGLRPRWVLCT